MSRQSVNEMQAGVIKNGFSYTKQCWIKDFVVMVCGHRQKESYCYSCAHAGEQTRFSE